MLAITHFLVTLLFIQIFLLDRNDAFVALLFGVFIDLDHLIGLTDYAHANGITALLDWSNLMDPGGQWKSIFHNPVAVVMVAPLAYASRLAIPLVFWGLHVSMDLVQDGLLGQFSQAEAMLGFFSCALLVTLRYSKHIESGDSSTIFQYLKSDLSQLRRIRISSQGF